MQLLQLLLLLQLLQLLLLLQSLLWLLLLLRIVRCVLERLDLWLHRSLPLLIQALQGFLRQLPVLL